MKTFANFVMSDLMDMIQSLADPYMFYNKDGKHNLVLLAVVFVDNVLLVGTEKMVKWFKTKILTRFNYTDLGKLQKHLGLWYKWGKDKHGDTFIKATMDLLFDKTIEAFRNVTGHYASPVSMPLYAWLSRKSTSETQRGRISYVRCILESDRKNHVCGTKKYACDC